MNIPCSQVNSCQVERPNKAYQIAEPDNRAARVEWLSDTVEREDTTDRIASAPAASARLVNSMAWLVEFEPAPAITRARPPAISTAVRVTLSCSAGDRVEVSPAASQTTRAGTPASIWRS